MPLCRTSPQYSTLLNKRTKAARSKGWPTCDWPLRVVQLFIRQWRGGTSASVSSSDWLLKNDPKISRIWAASGSFTIRRPRPSAS